MRITDILMALPSLTTSSTMDRTPYMTVAEAAFSSPFGGAQIMPAPSPTTMTLRDFYDLNNVDHDAPSLLAGMDLSALPEGTDEPDTDPVSSEGDGVILPLRVETFDAEAGRVTTLDAAGFMKGADIAGIEILSQSTSGHISVNPDMSLAVVLSEDPANVDPFEFRYEITYANGDTQEVQAQVAPEASAQELGWSKGEYYMLEEDQSGALVIEHGDNHRKVYVTGSEDGLTRADIAAREGISESTVTKKWLEAHSEYGGSAEMALATDVGMDLWYHVSAGVKGPVSNWLLFERGYEYNETNRLIPRASNGESELHPIVIGAYGEGADPVINSTVKLYQENSVNIVVRDIDVQGAMVLQGGNLLVDGVSFSGQNGSINIQNMDGFTLRNSDIVDVFRETAVDDADTWNPHLNRISGGYIKNVEGLLIEGNLFDHNGWGDGYDPNRSVDSPQPPSMYSQNLYIQNDNEDVTLRDNVLMRGASFGAQVRSGGFVEDNVFIDNNAALNTLGGDYGGDGPIGHYSLLLDNLVTSAGHKRVSAAEGALSMGIDAWGIENSLVGNIIAHMADPNNPAEIAEKTVTHPALKTGTDVFFNDTIVYNWNAPSRSTNPDQNVDGLDHDILDQTTIQNFTAALLGQESATIADLADYLRAQYSGASDTDLSADQIIAWFREGFGLDTDLRDASATLRFVPDERGDGMRWDNRLNWDSGDLPGTRDGDSIDLGGNKVLFGGQTVTVDDFIFGDYGALRATSGRLNIDGRISVSETGASLEIDNAGQVWTRGYLDSDQLRIDVSGGRFANEGVFAGAADLSLDDNGQVLLATAGGSFDLAAGSQISITGTRAKLGFDGATGDTAVLRMHDGAALEFVSTADGLGGLSEFRSGAFGEASNVTSGIHLDGTLRIDLAAWDASATAGAKWTVIDADQIIGGFDAVDIIGMAGNRDAALQVDYVRDEVRLLISAEGTGTGAVRITEFGDSDFIDYTTDPLLEALWDDLNAGLPTLSDSPI